MRRAAPYSESVPEIPHRSAVPLTQFTRNQMTNVGAKPYTELIVSKRADRLASKFPQSAALVLSTNTCRPAKDVAIGRLSRNDT